MILLLFKFLVCRFENYFLNKRISFVFYIVLGCRNLPKMDVIGSSDPYVILELLPFSIYHKTQKEYKTSIKKRTLDPEYNELFKW